ncbi:lipoprotein [Angustibacter peucedani]
MRRRRTFAVALLLALVATTVALMTRDGDGPGAAAAGGPGSGAGATQQPSSDAARTASSGSTGGQPSADQSQTPRLLGDVAQLGPRTLKTVPAATRKAVVVRGDGPTSTKATIELYELSGGAWRKTASWRGHLGARGWTDDHREGDLRTPTGTYTLTDAGGRLTDPGTKLPYHRSNSFVPSGSGVFGDSLAGSFDYVIAIDFNRRKGVSPLDSTHPLGDAKGGGIWLHVDHDGPTHGCVSVPRAGMRTLLRELSPSDHPVVVMGDGSRLSA